jgi:4-amino-4-deoxy-L-arabinose transferase-like glycosyltransferase
MTNQKNMWLDWFVIALLILLPRLFNLDIFLTADEPLFMEQAQSFATGITTGQPAQTLGIGYPAVTVALWVAPFVADATPDLALYGVGRLAVGLLGAVLLLALFGVSRVLLGRWPAIFGVGLLALDPYTLGYSRLLHIAAPLAFFMTLSGLCWLVWLRDGQRRWPLFSGLFAGLALLTKSTALLLLPMLAVAGLVWGLAGGTWRSRRWWRQLMLGAALLLGVAAVTFVVLWPAMWVSPLEALTLAFGKLFTDQEAGAGNLGLFWFGRFAEDPGPAFYPVAFLLKSTPWLFLGLVLSVTGLFASQPEEERRQVSGPGLSLALWAFVLTYLLVMTVASKKSIRYMLPAFPTFYLLAGLAFTQTAAWFRTQYRLGLQHRHWSAGLIAAGLLTVMIFSFFYHPYYLSYYNPLFLGWRWAPDTVLVGWGEGLDGAGRYLEEKAEGATVAAWYEWLFPLLYTGPIEATVPQENMLTAERTVLYINQVQRDIPGPNIIHYFQTRRQPEHTVRLNGIDYAWVYPGPVAGFSPPASPEVPVGAEFDEQVRLLGYNLNEFPLQSGRPAVVTLYWQVLAPPAAERFIFLRLLDGQGQIWARADSPAVRGLWPVQRWQPGMFIEDAQELIIPPGTPPGTYQLEIGMYDPETSQPLPVTGGRPGPGGGFIAGEVDVAWQPVTMPDHTPATVVAASMSESVTLVGHSSLPDRAVTGEVLPLEMLWQESTSWWPWQTRWENNVLFTWVKNGNLEAEQFDPLPLPIDQWGKGAVLRSKHQVMVPAILTSGEYQLRATLHTGSDPVGRSQTIAQVMVTAPEHTFVLPENSQSPPPPATLALIPSGRMTLSGYLVAPGVESGGQIPIELYWQSDSTMATGYTVFVQLLGADSSVVSQSDATPGQGTRPTTGWIPGEIIADRHTLPLPDVLPSGSYRLITGLYDPLTGQRLPLVDPAGEIVGDSIAIIEVVAP